MSFDDEWARASAAAAEKNQTAMRLNTLDPGGGTHGGPHDLVVRQDDLGAVGNAAFALFQRFDRDGDVASESTAKAGRTLDSHGFDLGRGLTMTAGVWNSQRTALLQACAHISNHLDYTKQRHAEDEAEIEAVMRRRDGSASPIAWLDREFR
ncbi:MULTISPECIES: hypothetical protein [Streptomyces]|uniref:hypothetical protein n=1 Tax=Streptomyces TaxID=1883 RepID=UPI00224902A7|nr:hypothetical protein [Streptomyces sp. JHD 1]MCX2967556.1 hypothetical protein [Streptomyces sp. JHD 1]